MTPQDGPFVTVVPTSDVCLLVVFFPPSHLFLIFHFLLDSFYPFKLLFLSVPSHSFFCKKSTGTVHQGSRWNEMDFPRKAKPGSTARPSRAARRAQPASARARGGRGHHECVRAGVAGSPQEEGDLPFRTRTDIVPGAVSQTEEELERKREVKPPETELGLRGGGGPRGGGAGGRLVEGSGLPAARRRGSGELTSNVPLRLVTRGQKCGFRNGNGQTGRRELSGGDCDGQRHAAAFEGLSGVTCLVPWVPIDVAPPLRMRCFNRAPYHCSSSRKSRLRAKRARALGLGVSGDFMGFCEGR